MKTIRSTNEAKDHYYNGNGETVRLHSDIKDALLNSEKFKLKLDKILSGKTSSLTGDFSVDLTLDFFHVDRTNIEYKIVLFSSGYMRVNIHMFVNDGFWDANVAAERTLGALGIKKYQPDGLGPNLEFEGGTPYRYSIQTQVYTLKNPGYKH